MATKEVVSRTGTTWLDEGLGIARFQAFPGVEQGLDDAKENIAAVGAVTDGKKFPMLVDLTGSRGLGPEARAFYGTPEAGIYYRALALVGTSPVSRMLGNIWFAIYSGRRDLPTKLFGSNEEAIEWLKAFADR
jgi:hypothetical protein